MYTQLLDHCCFPLNCEADHYTWAYSNVGMSVLTITSRHLHTSSWRSMVGCIWHDAINISARLARRFSPVHPNYIVQEQAFRVVTKEASFSQQVTLFWPYSFCSLVRYWPWCSPCWCTVKFCVPRRTWTENGRAVRWPVMLWFSHYSFTYIRCWGQHLKRNILLQCITFVYVICIPLYAQSAIMY